MQPFIITADTECDDEVMFERSVGGDSFAFMAAAMRGSAALKVGESATQRAL